MGTPRFTHEFQEEAVHQITELGYYVAEFSDRLGVTAHCLYKCLRVIKPDNTEQHARDLLEAKSEILTLRARISRGAFARRRVARGTIGKRKTFSRSRGVTGTSWCECIAFAIHYHCDMLVKQLLYKEHTHEIRCSAQPQS